MRGSLVDVCGCFPTGRHYPGIAERIAQAVDRIEGLATEFDAAIEWSTASLAVLDFETTGLDPSVDRVIEVGVVRFEAGEFRQRFNQLINPEMALSEEARAVHQISDEELRGAPRFAEVVGELQSQLEGCLPVAYNAAFDRSFLLAELGRLPEKLAGALPPGFRPEVQWVDPLVWARELQREEKSKKLVDVCERLGIPLEQAHRASSDAEAAGRALLALAPQMPNSYGELIRIQSRYAAQQEAEFAAWRNRKN